jgi:hypothetical protein
MPKLTSIFSILFVSMFIMTIILTDDKWGLNEKSIPRPQLPTSESSSTIGDDFESKDLIIPSHKYLDESKSQSSQEQVLSYQTISMRGN